MKNRVKKQALSFAAAMAMILGGGMQLYAADKIADTVYHNGKIYTIAETAQEAKDIANAKKADVVATLNGKIVFVARKPTPKRKAILMRRRSTKSSICAARPCCPASWTGTAIFPARAKSTCSTLT